MTEPERLLTGSSPAARLLRSAELDVPGARSRRRALAAAAGAATIVTAGSSAAMGGGAALVKSAAIWLCVGAVSGGTVAAVTSYVSGSPPELPAVVAPPPVKPPVVAAPSARPTTTLEAPAPAIEPDVPEVQALPAARSGAASRPVQPAAPIVSPGGSVATFDVPKERRPGLYEELKWLEAARGAVGRGEYASALATLDRYDAGYPAGHFRPESMALRIEALSRLGNRDAARALADRFRRSYPSHPLLARVRAAVGD